MLTFLDQLGPGTAAHSSLPAPHPPTPAVRAEVPWELASAVGETPAPTSRPGDPRSAALSGPTVRAWSPPPGRCLGCALCLAFLPSANSSSASQVLIFKNQDACHVPGNLLGCQSPPPLLASWPFPHNSHYSGRGCVRASLPIGRQLQGARPGTHASPAPAATRGPS